MKVLVISSLYYPHSSGGAEKNTQILAEELVKRGHEVVVATTSDKTFVDYVNGVKVCYIKTRNLYWGFHAKKESVVKKFFWHLLDAYNFLMKKEIAAIIEAEQPDIAQTNNLSGFSAAIWDVLKKYRIPIVHIIHDHYLICLKTTMFSGGRNCSRQCLQCKIFSIPKKVASERLNSVIGVSQYILDQHLTYGYFTKTRQRVKISNIFDIQARQRTVVTTSGPLRFGFVGQISFGKGIELVLRIFANLETEELYIYGKSQFPGYEQDLRTRFGRRNIKFMGYKNNLQEVYESFDILIFPSLWRESAGRVVIEAYSFGVPVIASDIGGIGEFIDDGKTGFVFDPANPHDLEEKIKWFGDNRHRLAEMSQNCLHKIDEYAKEKVIEQYITVHQDLITGYH